MNVKDIVMEMEFAGVGESDIAAIMKVCESRGFNVEVMDEELQKRGYEKLFTPDYDMYDEYGEWDDDDYTAMEKFPGRNHYGE